MSQRSIALACRDQLQDHFGWDDTQCDITPRGQPPAVAGELFIGIAEGGMDNNSAGESLDEIHRVTVVVTRRLPQAPWDRAGTEIVHKSVIGAEVWADNVKAFIHRSYAVINAANTYLTEAVASTVTIYGFSAPLMFRGQSNADVKNGSWFHGDGADEFAGVAITLQFGIAERLQSITAQS